MKNAGIFLYLFALAFIFACQSDKKPDNALLFSKNNLLAWCIVPFDNLNRTPEERSAMLDDLGIKQFAYDMLKILKESGYNGSIGILGHVEDVDVNLVLARNLKGLKSLLKEMGAERALATY